MTNNEVLCLCFLLSCCCCVNNRGLSNLAHGRGFSYAAILTCRRKSCSDPLSTHFTYTCTHLELTNVSIGPSFGACICWCAAVLCYLWINACFGDCSGTPFDPHCDVITAIMILFQTTTFSFNLEWPGVRVCVCVWECEESLKYKTPHTLMLDVTVRGPFPTIYSILDRDAHNCLHLCPYQCKACVHCSLSY